MATEVKAPWLKNYGSVPATLDYYKGTMWEMVEDAANIRPKHIAYDFMGKATTYEKFKNDVHNCAKALRAAGVKPNDRVTVCMPNCPQAVVMFYAINLMGGVSNMVHPLSSENEIQFYLSISKSTCALTLDQFYSKFERIRKNVPALKTLVIATVKDELKPLLKLGYSLTEGKKIPKLPENGKYVTWKEFIKKGKTYSGKYICHKDKNEAASILYSGGTTGTTKGILLSNYNLNALSEQVISANPIFEADDKMLAVMPIFHGFGLGVSIHTVLSHCGRCVLVPRFTPKTYAHDILKHRCNFIAGVPTLFEALLRQPEMKNADLSCLKGVFSGGDTLTPELKKRFDKFLKDHGASVVVREGYGTTECVTASCLTPLHLYKDGSIGQPFADTYYKIVEVGTNIEVPYGQEGEICISGPTVMLGYLDNPEETANTLRVHGDGRTWLHTGDLGTMDDEGFIYFRQRIKRMIITSGYNVYPSQLENVLEGHPAVQMACIIGVPDPYKIQKVKAFIKLRDGFSADGDTKASIMNYCKKNIAKYAMPYDIEFRDTLPTTLVGKVAYRVLEEEEAAKRKEAETVSPR